MLPITERYASPPLLPRYEAKISFPSTLDVPDGQISLENAFKRLLPLVGWLQEDVIPTSDCFMGSLCNWSSFFRWKRVIFHRAHNDRQSPANLHRNIFLPTQVYHQRSTWLLLMMFTGMYLFMHCTIPSSLARAVACYFQWHQILILADECFWEATVSTSIAAHGTLLIHLITQCFPGRISFSLPCSLWAIPWENYPVLQLWFISTLNHILV